MRQYIRLRDIYCDDLYARSRASELRSQICKDAESVTLDFDQIGFMSRSFTDELNNIMDDLDSISFNFVNRNEDITSMMTKVAEGRKHERVRGVGNAKMYKFNDMESLSKHLLAM